MPVALCVMAERGEHMLLCHDKQLVHAHNVGLKICLKGTAELFESFCVVPGVQPGASEGSHNVLELVAIPEEHEKVAETRVYVDVRMSFVSF